MYSYNLSKSAPVTIFQLFGFKKFKEISKKTEETKWNYRRLFAYNKT